MLIGFSAFQNLTHKELGKALKKRIEESIKSNSEGCKEKSWKYI